MVHEDARLEFYVMVKRGMSGLQAIQNATINAADLLVVKIGMLVFTARNE